MTFVDDRPEGGERPDIVVVPEDDLVMPQWRNPLIGSRDPNFIRPHEADIERINKVDVSNYWDESLEDVV